MSDNNRFIIKIQKWQLALVLIVIVVAALVLPLAFANAYDMTMSEVEAYLEEKYNTEVYMIPHLHVDDHTGREQNDLYVVTENLTACTSIYTIDGTWRMDASYFLPVYEDSYERELLQHTPSAAHNIMALKGSRMPFTDALKAIGNVQQVSWLNETTLRVIVRYVTMDCELYLTVDGEKMVSKESVVRELYQKMYFKAIELYPWWTISTEYEV